MTLADAIRNLGRDAAAGALSPKGEAHLRAIAEEIAGKVEALETQVLLLTMVRAAAAEALESRTDLSNWGLSETRTLRRALEGQG